MLDARFSQLYFPPIFLQRGLPAIAGQLVKVHHSRFKNDNASQRKSGKFDPRSLKTPELIVPYICNGYYVGDCKDALACCVHCCYLLFTALHGMQTRSYDENSVGLSVRLSVCLSVKRVHCDKTEERYI